MDRETMRLAIREAAGEWREDVNYRLPYGLCKKYGIDVPPHTTPRGAWELLKNRGVIPEEEYRKLRERAGYPAEKGAKERIKRRDWEAAEGSVNTWQAPAWEGTAVETLRKHYRTEDGDTKTYAGVLDALHSDTEGAIRRAKTDGAFSEALESLIKQNAGWRGGPAVSACMIPEADWKDLREGERASWGPKSDTEVHCILQAQRNTRIWYGDTESALAALGGKKAAGEAKGERLCVFHVNSFPGRAMALPDGKVVASEDVRYNLDRDLRHDELYHGYCFDGDTVHVFLEERTGAYDPNYSPGSFYHNNRDPWDRYLPGLGTVAAEGAEPERLEPKAFASAEEADGYMLEHGHFYGGANNPGLFDGPVCESGKKAFAGALAALEERYGALDPDQNYGNEVTISCRKARLCGWESIPEVSHWGTGRVTESIELNGRWFGTENAFRALRTRVREDCERGIRMPCAEGMEAAYVTAEAYGECVKNLLLRKMGYTCDNRRGFFSGKPRDTRYLRHPTEEGAIENSIAAGEAAIYLDIMRIARALEPDPDPETLLDPDWYPGQGTEDDPGWDKEEQGERPGGELSRLKGSLFAESFANSVCGEPNVFGRAAAIYLDRCGIGRDGARGKAQERA